METSVHYFLDHLIIFSFISHLRIHSCTYFINLHTTHLYITAAISLFTHQPYSPTPFPFAFQSCVVCGDPAPFLQPSAALVCDSCRAFFWRSVVDASYKDFACANSWGCMVTVSARRACQACRLVLQRVVLRMEMGGFEASLG